MLHHAAGQQNNIQNNDAFGGGLSGGENAGSVGPPLPGNATVNATPRTLNQLWDALMVGLGGQTPAHLLIKE